MAAPSFDLAIGGIAAFTRTGTVFVRRPISRDPLSGVIDGANKVFHTNFFPVLTAGSLRVYDGADLVSGSADYDTGEITLGHPPAQQPVASYTFSPYNALQTLQFLISGFDEMELRWNRSFKLVDSSGAAADENSAQLLVADKTGADPVCGATVFSLSRVQIAYLMLCTEYRYYLSGAGDAAFSDFAIRETLRGMMVDKSKRPSNLQAQLAILERRLQAALSVAQDDFYPGGDQYGGAIYDPVTLDYAVNFEWQESSKQQGINAGLGYQYSNRIFYP